MLITKCLTINNVLCSLNSNPVQTWIFFVHNYDDKPYLDLHTILCNSNLVPRERSQGFSKGKALGTRLLQFKYMKFHIFTCIPHPVRASYEFTKWQLPVGLIIQLVEGTAPVSQRSWVRITFGPIGLNIFQACVPHNCDGHSYLTSKKAYCHRSTDSRVLLPPPPLTCDPTYTLPPLPAPV